MQYKYLSIQSQSDKSIKTYNTGCPSTPITWIYSIRYVKKAIVLADV